MLVGATLPACGGSGGGGQCGADAFPTKIKPADVAMNQAKPFIMSVQQGVFVCRDAGGLYAVNAYCTHTGCFVNFDTTTTSFNCPCHGATFDFNGENQTTPAPSPMPHYEMCVDSMTGYVEIDFSKMVDSKKRFAL
jgi:Rieske Fe-S protein